MRVKQQYAPYWVLDLETNWNLKAISPVTIMYNNSEQNLNPDLAVVYCILEVE